MNNVILSKEWIFEYWIGTSKLINNQYNCWKQTCRHLRSDVLYKNESIARDEEDGTLYNKGLIMSIDNQLSIPILEGNWG